MSAISSMWSRIFECPWPVDRVAALVAYARGWDATTAKQIEVSEYGKFTQPPPEGTCDYRGRRSFYNVVIGFSHRIKQRRRISPSKAAWRSENGLSRGAKFAYQHKCVWFVLRADGKVSQVNGTKLRKKLANMDKDYLMLVEQGKISEKESEEWLAISSIPAHRAPCNHKGWEAA